MSSGSGGLISEITPAGRISVHSGTESSLPVLIEGNTIGSRQGRPWEDTWILVVATGPGEVLVYDNTIQCKDVGAELCRGTLWHNRYINNIVNMRTRDYWETWEDIVAVENCWGTEDSLEVSERIVDCHDNAELEPCVIFELWSIGEACTATAVHAATWTSVKSLFR